MNTSISRSIIQLNAVEMKELIAEVKETVAVNVRVKKIRRTFIAAELWNIQKKRKSYALASRGIFM